MEQYCQWAMDDCFIDLAMWLLAILFFYSYQKVKNHKGLPVKKAKVTQEPEA